MDGTQNKGVVKYKFLCLLASPEGIANLTRRHPEVEIFVANVDDGLNEKGYIMPGLGDAGDRMFSTIPVTVKKSVRRASSDKP